MVFLGTKEGSKGASKGLCLEGAVLQAFANAISSAYNTLS